MEMNEVFITESKNSLESIIKEFKNEIIWGKAINKTLFHK